MAVYLGNNGFRVALFERNWNSSEDIVGELLQPGGVKMLQDLRLYSVLENIDAQHIEGYAMFLNGEFQKLSYPNDDHKHPSGFGFRYGKLIRNLRKLAEENSNVDCVEASVQGLSMEDSGNVNGVVYKADNNETAALESRITIVSQGSLSSLRKGLNKAKTDIKGYMLGLVLEDAELPFESHGHVIMADPAPVLVYPVGSGKVRVLIDFPKEEKVLKGDALESYLLDHIKPQLPEILQQKFEEAVFRGGFKMKPTCLLASRPVLKSNVILLGDSLNMRHPTTGGGMTVALTDVKALGDRLIEIGDLDNSYSVRRSVAEFYKKRHESNATVNILAFALYSVFRHKVLRKACFDYLKRGGRFSAGPMSILSGVSRSRWTLFKHFFAVAGFAILHQEKKRSWVSDVKGSITLLSDAVKIIFPLIRDEMPKTYKQDF